MIPSPFDDIIALFFIAFATVGALVFILLYAALTPWHASPVGRHLMVLTTGLAGLGVISLLRRVLDEWYGYDLTVIVVYALIGWELWHQTLMLLRAQSNGHEEER